MIFNKKILYIFSSFLLMLIACSLGSSNNNPDSNQVEVNVSDNIDQSAEGNNANSSNDADSASTSIPSDTPIPTETNTPEPTATVGPPTVVVSADTNCRTGPHIIFDYFGVLKVGQIAEVVGVPISGSEYLIVKLPGNNLSCWLWLEYATVTGDTSHLSTVNIPPTPTPTHTPTPVFEVTNLSMDAIFKNIGIVCPIKNVFTVEITVNTSGTVTYYWERSDGWTGSEIDLVFNGAGSKEITFDWIVVLHTSAYAKLNIVSPNNESIKYDFTVNCV